MAGVLESKRYDELINELISFSQSIAKTEAVHKEQTEKLDELIDKLRNLISFLDENSTDLACVVGDLSEDKKKLEDSGMNILQEFGELNEGFNKERRNLKKAIELLEENGIEIAKNFGELWEEKMRIEREKQSS